MVEGRLYQWRLGAAIYGEDLPESCIYYGDIRHIEGAQPEADGEFAPAFAVSGEICIYPDAMWAVYLRMTTDWLENTTVIFDEVETAGP